MVFDETNLPHSDDNDMLDVVDIPCKTWDYFKSEANKLIVRENIPLEEKEWIFRGILKCHPLKTTLERVCENWSVDLAELPFVEFELIREIKRKAFGLGIPLPHEYDDMWWVSLMQHQGGPTRLLDFTYSPFVAAYFAFEQLFNNPDQNDAAVWAIQHKFTTLGANQVKDIADLENVRRSEIKSMDFLFNTKLKKNPSVLQLTGYYLHDRITAQQGIFLCPTDISVSFAENFRSVSGYQDKDLVRRFILPREIMRSAVVELQKMNITAHSLFPGIGGLSKSLGLRLPYFAELARHRCQSKTRI